MITKLKVFTNNNVWVSGLFLTLFVVLAYQKLAFYVRFDFNFILLLIVLPFVVKQKNNKKSIRYGLIAIFLLLIYPFLKLSSIYFFAFICSIFFLYESRFGKLTSLPLFLVIIVSPVAIFLSEIIGFEIRLNLTKMAANVLSFVDKDYTSIGNIIMLGKQEFHVDPECMGLKMVILSLFITLVFISFRQKAKQIGYNIFSIIISLISAFLLVIISNLFRIILITLFKSFPGSFAHELIGIICFIIYIVIPIWFIIKIMPSKKSGLPKTDTNHSIKKSHYYILVILLTILFSVFRFSSLGEKELSSIDLSSININTESFNNSIEKHGVLKLTNEKILIYIKPASSFYSADHSPIICWKGSGYQVQQEQIINLAEMDVFFSELKLKNENLYSTWWYDCGDDKTISQFRWRIQSLLSNKNYRLVNVISYEKQALYDETEKLVRTNIFPK